jgi:hypothetical protein
MSVPYKYKKINTGNVSTIQVQTTKSRNYKKSAMDGTQPQDALVCFILPTNKAMQISLKEKNLY